MHKQPTKESPKKGRASPTRKAPRRASTARLNPHTERAEAVPVYAWREEGDPPEVIRQGTLDELGERQCAGARTSGISVVAQHGVVTKTYTKRAKLLLQQWLKKSNPPKGACEAKRSCLAESGWSGWTRARGGRHVIITAPDHARQAKLATGPSTTTLTAESPTTEPGAAPVPVPAELLRAAREKTGIESDAELVAFALSLLVEPDPAAEFLREERGSLPRDFRLDV